MRIKIIAIIIMLVCSSCTNKTIYVPHGQAVRLRQRVKNVRVWVLDKEGTPVEGNMDIPDGWYCLPKGDK